MKVLILSHKADCDGITPVILTRYAFSDVTSILLDNGEVEERVLELVTTDEWKSYDQIFMTDLCVSEKVADIIVQKKIPFLVFDHHISVASMNRYSFIEVIDTLDGRKECGTSNFYRYLLENYANEKLTRKSVSEFVDLVRSIDTWEWASTNRREAVWLGNLFDLYGREYFEEHYYQVLQEQEIFSFSKEEEFLLSIEDRRKKSYIASKEEKIIPIKIQDYVAGFVFAEQYRSELGHTLATKFNDQYDFIIIAKGSSISLRGEKEVPLNEIATYYGGGGHKNAAGIPITKEKLKAMISILLPNCEVLEDEDRNS